MKKINSKDMSIDEILKSIRGIINTHKKDKPLDDEDILELTEISEDNNEVNLIEDKESENLISPEIAQNLNRKIKDFKEKAKAAPKNTRKSLGDISVEELLLELLSNELKLWLDTNLPDIIEHTLVQELRHLVREGVDDNSKN